jgi:predicted dehydrogenase
MAAILSRSARSVNIKDRLDFSCGILTADGRLCANAPNVPVHLGALGACVRSIAALRAIEPGEVILTNHPAFGGSHLPDITVVRAVHEAAAAGRFGTLAVAASSVPWWRDDAYYGPGRWQGTKALDGGGALMNQSIHGVDALQWIAGATMPGLAAGENPVESVMAMTAVRAHDAERLEVEDTCVAILRFKNGALGQLLAATSVFPGQLRRLLVGGRDGTAEILEEQLVAWRFRSEQTDDEATRVRFGGSSGTSGGAADPLAINYACHTRNIEAFLEAIRAGRPPELDGHEGRKAVAIVEACYRSARTSRIAVVK